MPTESRSSARWEMTYSQMLEGLGKRAQISVKLGLPTKTAREYHMQRLFKLEFTSDAALEERGVVVFAGSVSMKFRESVDMKHISKGVRYWAYFYLCISNITTVNPQLKMGVIT